MPSLSSPMSYHRLNRAPLDDMETFSSLRDLMDYCDSGARYDGQRVAVLSSDDTELYDELYVDGEQAQADDDTLIVRTATSSISNKYTEYVINNDIPMIDMRGSEPIFKKFYFNGDSTESHGLLIYENNGNNVWDQGDVFRFDLGALCLINQLEIFRIGNAVNDTKTFKFAIERIYRDSTTSNTYKWSQTYNPYIDGINHKLTQSNTTGVSGMSFNLSENSWLLTNNSNIILMPRTAEAANAEMNIITRIYVKAEDYYNAWK